MVNYLSGRPTVGRLAFHVAFNTESATPRREAYRAELLQSLAAVRPSYIAVSRRSMEVADSLNQTNIARGFPALARFITDGYRPVARIDAFEVYQRK